MAGCCLVAVRKRAVERILPGREFYGNVIAPARGIGIVKTPVVFGPIFVPGTRPIRDRIISARLFADPKDRCHDVFFPWIMLSRLRRCGMLGREQKGTNIQKIIRQFVRFFTSLDLGGLRLRWCRVCEKRGNRRQQSRDRVSNGSRFHLVNRRSATREGRHTVFSN